MKRLVTTVLLVLALGASALASADETVLFRLDGQAHRASDLPDALALKLNQLDVEHYYKLQQLVDDAVVDAWVSQQAAASGRDREQVRNELLAVTPATETEIEALYRANKARIGAPFTQVRDRIASFIEGQRRVVRQRELVARLAEEGRLERTLVEPLPPRIDIDISGYPARGAENPTVTVVEFADYQCPFCRAAGGVLEQMLSRYGDRLRVVFVDFPINPSGISRIVARGAACAAEQGRFWDYHDLAFERQRQLDASAPGTLAAALKLDMTAFQSCLAAPRAQAVVARGAAEAARLGLDSTPTLFLNGRRLILPSIERDLPVAIEAALAEAG